MQPLSPLHVIARSPCLDGDVVPPRSPSRPVAIGTAKRQVGQRSLRGLGLGSRLIHALHRAGVRSVPGLCGLSERKLLLIPGVGHRSITAIRTALASRLLSLHDDTK